MTSRKLTELTCDKCGSTEILQPHDPNLSKWGRMFVGSLDGKDVIGTIEVLADICPPCVDEIVAFYRGETK